MRMHTDLAQKGNLILIMNILMNKLTVDTLGMRAFVILLFSFVMSGAVCAEVMDYKLGPGDIVRITVYGHEDLITEDRITERGYISFPLLGEVAVSSFTKGEVEQRIAQMLEAGELIKKPSVTVRVVQYHSQQVSVIGMVMKPGTFDIDKPSSLLEMLARAGGIAPDGSDRITILRKQDGKDVRLEVDTMVILKHGKAEDNVNVAIGDVVFVPPAPKNYVYGEIQRPGVYKLQRDMTELQALAVGGGLTPRGTDNAIKIIRHVDGVQVQTMDSRLTDIVIVVVVIRVKDRLFCEAAGARFSVDQCNWPCYARQASHAFAPDKLLIAKRICISANFMKTAGYK